MIKNLNQLKRVLRPGMRLEVIGHCRPGCIGQLREVTWVNTQGFYTKTLNPPDPKLNAANEGRGAILWWGAARTWEFEDGVCKSYTRSEHTAETLIMAFRVPFPVSWTVKMKKKQKETQDILSYHTQAAGCSDKARAKASGGRQPIEECGRTGL